MKDLYRILGIAKSAQADEIKKAYRLLAKKSHPDLHPGDPLAETRFKEINEAYEILGNPQKKKAYDAARVRKEEKKVRQDAPKAVPSPVENINFNGIRKEFKQYFGFDPNSVAIENGKNGKGQKDPLDTSAAFFRFMGLK